MGSTSISILGNSRWMISAVCCALTCVEEIILVTVGFPLYAVLLPSTRGQYFEAVISFPFGIVSMLHQ